MDRRALEKQQAEPRGWGVREGAILTEKCQLQRQQMGEDQEKEREKCGQLTCSNRKPGGEAERRCRWRVGTLGTHEISSSHDCCVHSKTRSEVIS